MVGIAAAFEFFSTATGAGIVSTNFYCHTKPQFMVMGRKGILQGQIFETFECIIKFLQILPVLCKDVTPPTEFFPADQVLPGPGHTIKKRPVLRQTAFPLWAHQDLPSDPRPRVSDLRAGVLAGARPPVSLPSLPVGARTLQVLLSMKQKKRADH